MEFNDRVGIAGLWIAVESGCESGICLINSGWTFEEFSQ
jgi:hypothetical protein